MIKTFEMETDSISILSTNKKIDYNHFINPHSSRRRPLITRELTKLAYAALKDTVSLAEGMPNDITFPFERIQIHLKDGSAINLHGNELNTSLQYIPSQGYPPLIETLKELTQRISNPPNWHERDILVTNGSQDGISKSIEMCLEPGDAVLVQNPLYGGTEIVLRPFRAELLPIEQDAYGMCHKRMVRLLEERKSQGKAMPKLLYVNPTGSNPTGTTMSPDRRRLIYKTCCEYNILILEDDAYCYMNFSEDIYEKLPTFLSLDTEGRVLRFDSISKVISPGLRLAWITGPKPLINVLELHMQSSMLHASTLSQIIVENLFKKWKIEGFLRHAAVVKEFYRRSRDITLAAMDRHLKNLCDWTVPAGGMFVWIEVRGITDVYDMLMVRGLRKGVFFTPGHAFRADPTEACNCIRASYSKSSPKQIEKAMKFLAELIREELELVRRKLNNCT